jgi:nucleotide-binding universal stress UspA family protein
VTRVLAAIDCSAAARPVLSAASAVADLLGADVDAVHIREQACATAQAAADAAGVHLRVLSGRTLERIMQEAAGPNVLAVVLGARATPGGARPAGHVATHLATSSRKPIVVVPPECAVPVRLRRILVPLEAVMATASAVDSVVVAAAAGGAEIVVVHVMTEQGLPPFTDQPQHEVEAWTNEFRRRYCDHPEIHLEVRMGVPRERVLAFAEEMQADAVILAWSQRLTTERAALVRSVLEHSRIPVILVPVARTAKRVPTRCGRWRAHGVAAAASPIRLRTCPGGHRRGADASRLRPN